MILETFIKGIEVMSKSEIKEPTETAMVIGIVIGFILFCMVYCLIDDKQIGQIASGITFLLTFIIAMVLSIHPTGEYEYKVTIDDTVSLNEFNEKYEITDQEGKIYTIRFKE